MLMSFGMHTPQRAPSKVFGNVLLQALRTRTLHDLADVEEDT